MDAIRLKLTKARTALLLDDPFFGTIALHLQLIEDNTAPYAMWTDGKHIGYNPKMIEPWSIDETKGVICHEVMHVAVLHHVRRGERDHEKWNIAGDYAINGLIAGKYKLPGEPLLNPAFNGKSTEEIYTLIPDGQKGKGQGKGKGCAGMCGEVRDAKTGASDAELAQAEAEAKVLIAQAHQIGKRAGKLPHDLDAAIGKSLKERSSLAQIIRSFVERNARDDYSWMPPNKNYVCRGLYLPSMRSETLPLFAVVLDESGSISEQQLNEFSSELTFIMEEHKAELDVIHCDTEVHLVEHFTSEDLPLELRRKCCGGTDFRPAFSYIEEHELNPKFMIFFTDLETNGYPDKEPEYPVLWLVEAGTKLVPPFGEIVEIPNG